MKIALLNDTHCGTRNSSDIFLDNAEKFYNDVFFPCLLERGISHIVHLGDYYDNRKFINFRALNRNRNHFLKPLRENGMTMDIICGNHDTYYKNTNELNSLKELLGHYMNEVNILHEPTVMDYDGFKLGLVPWISAENEKQSLDFIANAKCDWLGGHFDIEGYEMMKGRKCEHGLQRSIFSRFEKVLSGHFHTKSIQDNIEYLGSQMEFFWNDAHDDKYFHIFDTETRELTPVRNPITIFKKVVYNDQKTEYNTYDVETLKDKFVKVVVVNKSEPYLFDKFIDRIQGVDTHELKIAETFDEFMGENVADSEISIEDTTTLLDSYVDAVDTDLDKDRIKTMMRGLYVEAQNQEII